MELAPKISIERHVLIVRLAWTAAYAIDRGVTLSFKFTFEATFRRTGFLPDVVFCDLAAGGMFSTLSSSSEISLAEEGEVNMALYTCINIKYKT
jgi:hypothetical protein